MDLRTHYPYWLLKNGIVNVYPSLHRDIRTEVAIMGAGVAGALACWYLQKKGFQVVVLDKRHVGSGSTAASTSLLQYEIDTPLRELIALVGERNANRSYELGIESLKNIAKISDELGTDVGFAHRKSFQFASHKKDVSGLEEEYRLRKKIGIDLRFLDPDEVKSKYGFAAPGGLLSATGAEIDAYAFTHAIFNKCKEPQVRIFDKTEIKNIRHSKKTVELETSSGFTIKADYLIIACGYESQKYIPKKIQDLDSTYAIVSEPMRQKKMWFEDSLIWETAQPYLYLRTTSDRRILIGGKDDEFQAAYKRNRALPSKARALEHAFSKLFPRIEFKTDFQWAGAFASTKDGLPFIGSIRQRPRTYFGLGFGGNGITFSAMAGKMIAAMLSGSKNPDAEIFSFDR
ncbi:MAG TPA: FAD-dependent oxidoreductase [Cyclobacteriaceae bacterium]|nr:FAD-dependent oxidoreductase [Cyclobacteriaceae bacterium]